MLTFLFVFCRSSVHPLFSLLLLLSCSSVSVLLFILLVSFCFLSISLSIASALRGAELPESLFLSAFSFPPFRVRWHLSVYFCFNSVFLFFLFVFILLPMEVFPIKNNCMWTQIVLGVHASPWQVCLFIFLLTCKVHMVLLVLLGEDCVLDRKASFLFVTWWLCGTLKSKTFT